ncbi:hypothetical protein FGO68_gene14024 [Halteria grandinella]|uniref:Uncharacterized protein n=1 Tax=Halteria grandinella TaxID=5974 RepID=A0A8J8T0E2_HALGN|nr:hypothetical protein FGO68_gene14024 [Halteria grandinella]
MSMAANYHYQRCFSNLSSIDLTLQGLSLGLLFQPLNVQATNGSRASLSWPWAFQWRIFTSIRNPQSKLKQSQKKREKNQTKNNPLMINPYHKNPK